MLLEMLRELLLRITQFLNDLLIIAFMLRIVTDIFDTIHRYVASTLEIDFLVTTLIEIAVTWYAAYKLNQLRD